MGRFDKLEMKREERGAAPEQSSRSDPGQAAPDWLAQAVEERRTGRHENALRYYSRALEDDKSLVIGWVGQVQMLVLLHEFVEAELWSRKALELFPQHGDLLAGRAQAQSRQGKTKSALELSDASLKSQGQSAYRWLVRGELMAATGQATDRHCFDKALLADGDWLVALEIAQVYEYLGKPTAALNRIRQAVLAAPLSFHPWFVQGRIERDLGMESAAAKSWTRCLELCPGHIDAATELQNLETGGWSIRRLWRRVFGR